MHKMYPNEKVLFEGLRSNTPESAYLNGDRNAITWYHAILTKVDFGQGKLPVTVLSDGREVASYVAELYAITPK